MSSDTNFIDDGHGVSRNVLQIHALYTSIPTHMLDERRKRVTLYRYQFTISALYLGNDILDSYGMDHHYCVNTNTLELVPS